MEFLRELLPVILYFLLCILVIVLVILVIRVIKSLKNIDEMVDDVKSKSKKLDGVFDIVDKATDSFTLVSDRFVNFISNRISNIFKRKGKDEEDE